MFEFEDLLADVTQGQILAVEAGTRGLTRFVVSRRAARIYRRAEAPVFSGIGPKILFVLAHDPGALRIVAAVHNWRRTFDIVAGFVTEPSLPWVNQKIEKQFDHFFVPVEEDLEPVRTRTGVPVSLLASAADVLAHGDTGPNRPIDVVAYGRMPADLHRVLQLRLNHPGTDRIYLHSPFGMKVGQDWQLARRLFWKLLKISRVALCFDTTVPGDRVMPHHRSQLTPRWFECMTAGCTVAGLRPAIPLTSKLLDWEDAIVDIPDDPNDVVSVIEQLADNHARLNAARRRAYDQLASRHDWRHRIADAFKALSLPLPPKLKEDLEELNHRLKKQKDAVQV